MNLHWFGKHVSSLFSVSGVFYTGFAYPAFHHIVCVHIPILANTNNYVIYLAHNVIVTMNKYVWSAPSNCLQCHMGKVFYSAERSEIE